MGLLLRFSISAAAAAVSTSGCRCGHAVPPASLSFELDGQLIEALQVTESRRVAIWQLDAVLPGSRELRIVVTLVRGGWPIRGESVTVPLGLADPETADYAQLRLATGTYDTGPGAGTLRLHNAASDCLPCQFNSPAGAIPIGDCPHKGDFDFTVTHADGTTHRISKGRFTVW